MLIDVYRKAQCLEPYIFCLYINNIPDTLEHCKIHMYADDAQIYNNSSLNGINACVNNINSDLQKIDIWAKNSWLCINPTKSKCISNDIQIIIIMILFFVGWAPISPLGLRVYSFEMYCIRLYLLLLVLRRAAIWVLYCFYYFYTIFLALFLIIIFRYTLTTLNYFILLMTTTVRLLLSVILICL